MHTIRGSGKVSVDTIEESTPGRRIVITSLLGSLMHTIIGAGNVRVHTLEKLIPELTSQPSAVSWLERETEESLPIVSFVLVLGNSLTLFLDQCLKVSI